MASLSIKKEEKLIALTAAKEDFERDLYKTFVKLGLNPDTYDMDDFEFDADVPLDEQDADYLLQKHADMLIQRLEKISTKIAEL